MDKENCKLFIGGISWGTDEQCLKNYFSNHGEVNEAVIMRDRSTGRARGFGFVVFKDSSDAERVTKQKHMIDGRINTKLSSIDVPATPGCNSKKIFVGGLASSVTEGIFKSYFDQFGTINDVVVMYDHKTQRPRGFGFITFDSEEAVDMVLRKTFHELNGKPVEVKRAVPKERSPVPNRSLYLGQNENCFELDWSSSIVDKFGYGCNVRSVGGIGRSEVCAIGTAGYDQISPNRLVRFTEPIDQITGRTDSIFDQDIWGNCRTLTNSANLGTFLSFTGQNVGEFEPFGRIGGSVNGDNRTGRNGFRPESDGYGGNRRWGAGEGNLKVLGSIECESKVGGNNKSNWQFLDGLSGVHF